MIARARLRLVAICGIMLIVGILSVAYVSRCVLYEEWNADKVESTMRDGDVIVEQVRAFWDRHGVLPMTLDELHVTLPRPKVGVSGWVYRQGTGECAFELSVMARRGYPSMRVACTRTHREWKVDM